MKAYLLAAAALCAVGSAQPAFAQDADTDVETTSGGDWTGAYFGGRIGIADVSDDDDETVLFDTNLDGTFDPSERVRVAVPATAPPGTVGADAFTTGFCGGTALAATGPRATPAIRCRGDSERTQYAGHVGFDFDLGRIVVGVLGEYERDDDLADTVTAFSTTPANYVLSRELRDSFAVRARVGYDFGSTLAYVTGGGVYGRFRNTFSSSNTANAFEVTNGREEEFGYRVGGGLEQRFGPNLSLGLQYLFTSIEDEESGVLTTRGTAPATNPFILVNPNGTAFLRSNERFDYANWSVTASFRF